MAKDEDPASTVSDAVAGPTGAVKIGEQCPHCGSAQTGKTFGAMHWVLSIGLFPVGLLSLLLPWTKCQSCGCVFCKGWLKPAPADQADQADEADQAGEASDAGPLCWYCDTVASSRKLDEDLMLHKGLKETQVCIPRCEVCMSVRSSVRRAKWAGLGIGVLWTVIIGAEGGESAGAVFWVGVVFALIGWVIGGIVGKKIGRARAAAAGLEIKPAKAWKLYPPIAELLGSGWKLGDASVEREEAAKPPEKCPVCGGHTGKVGILANTVNLTVANLRHTVAERCVVCGQWGCRLCMHFHGEGGAPIWKGTHGRVDEFTVVSYRDPAWRHNGCCDCGFGTINGETAAMG